MNLLSYSAKINFIAGLLPVSTMILWVYNDTHLRILAAVLQLVNSLASVCEIS